VGGKCAGIEWSGRVHFQWKRQHLGRLRIRKPGLVRGATIMSAMFMMPCEDKGSDAGKWTHSLGELM